MYPDNQTYFLNHHFKKQIAMKKLLPILKTKLFLLSFVSGCTVILATTVPQVRNLISSEKTIKEKVTSQQKKISPNVKKAKQDSKFIKSHLIGFS
jgi:predicted PurR-regulated permease PerM